jgi:hypothetical protein
MPLKNVDVGQTIAFCRLSGMAEDRPPKPMKRQRARRLYYPCSNSPQHAKILSRRSRRCLGNLACGDPVGGKNGIENESAVGTDVIAMRTGPFSD